MSAREWDGATYDRISAPMERNGLLGFADVRTGLVQRPAPHDELRTWLRVNALSAQVGRLPADLHDGYIDAVTEALGPEPTITYIRLDMDATAAGW